jgi:hypothetical protein
VRGARVQRLVDWARVLEFDYVIVENVVISGQLRHRHVNYKTVEVRLSRFENTFSTLSFSTQY